jgi:hypothetical protein
MKFVKRLALNRKDPASNRFAVEADDRIVTTSKKSLQLPSGANSDRPTTSTSVNGMIRYNSTLNDSEIYNISSGPGWEKVLTNRQHTVTIQNLPTRYDSTIYFGPLSYNVDTTKPQNVLVFVDNIWQVPVTDYILRSGLPTSTLTNVAVFSIGAQTITVNTVSNVLLGQTVSGPAGIFASGTTITDINTVTSQITISQGTLLSANVNPGVVWITLSASSGTYISFQAADPYSNGPNAKPIHVLLGFDGYSPL